MNTPTMGRAAFSRIAGRSVWLLVAALGLVVVSASTASAKGGWAVASLDAIPTPRAGATEVVGFTILQHGVRPVDLLDEPGNEVGIELTGTDGSTEFFPAVSDGPVGHYEAAVVFDEAGDYSWSIAMGWFGLQELGTLSVAGAVAPPDGTSWSAVRVVLSSLAALLTVAAFVDLWSSRRRARPSLT